MVGIGQMNEYRKTRYMSGLSVLYWMLLDLLLVPKARLANYGSDITSSPALAPLRSLAWSSLTTFQTSSLRSLRFESRYDR